MSGPTILELYDKHGFNILPCPHKTKGTYDTWKKYQEERIPREKIIQTLNALPEPNWAALMGKTSGGIYVFDLDLPEKVDAKIVEGFPPTWVVKTGGGIGFHYYFKDNEDVPNIGKKESLGWDLLGFGKLAMLPPSIHDITGKRYEWIENGVEIPYFSHKELLKRLGYNVQEAKQKKNTQIEKAWEEVKEGARDTTAFELALKQRRAGNPQSVAEKILRDWNNAACKPPLSDWQLIKCVNSAYSEKYVPKNQKTNNKKWFEYGALSDEDKALSNEDLSKPQNEINCFDDRGNVISSKMAEYILKNENIKTFTDTDEIYGYDLESGLWIPFESRLKHNIETLAGKATNFDVRETLGHIQRRTYEERPIQIESGLIPLQNGFYNLNEKRFCFYEPTFVFFTKLPIVYDEKADCPKIKKFISEVVKEREVLTIQEVFGHLLESNYRTQKAIVFLGEGANGKSTLISIMKTFLGKENVANQTIQALCADRFATASLYQKYANLSPDLPTNGLATTGLFKALTGNDTITAQKKGKNAFEFVNSAKLVFSANALPKSEDDTTAFWRRWLMIDFPNTFEGDKANKTLINELTTPEEISGLFNWALEGLCRLQEKNWIYSTEDRIEKARTRYLKASDSLKYFVEACVSANPTGWIAKEEFYNKYVEYCRKENVMAVTKIKVGSELSKTISVETTYRKGKEDHQVKAWQGIAWKNEEVEENNKKGTLREYERYD